MPRRLFDEASARTYALLDEAAAIRDDRGNCAFVDSLVREASVWSVLAMAAALEGGKE